MKIELNEVNCGMIIDEYNTEIQIFNIKSFSYEEVNFNAHLLCHSLFFTGSENHETERSRTCFQ